MDKGLRLRGRVRSFGGWLKGFHCFKTLFESLHEPLKEPEPLSLFGSLLAVLKLGRLLDFAWHPRPPGGSKK